MTKQRLLDLLIKALDLAGDYADRNYLWIGYEMELSDQEYKQLGKEMEKRGMLMMADLKRPTATDIKNMKKRVEDLTLFIDKNRPFANNDYGVLASAIHESSQLTTEIHILEKIRNTKQ